LAPDAGKPCRLADVVFDAGCAKELRRPQRPPADKQDRQSIGRCVDGAIDGDQSAGAGLVGRQHLRAELLFQTRDERAHIGIVAAARASHRVEPHLLALIEEGRRLRRRAQRRACQKTCPERSHDAARDPSSATRHLPRSNGTSALRLIPYAALSFAATAPRSILPAPLSGSAPTISMKRGCE